MTKWSRRYQTLSEALGAWRPGQIVIIEPTTTRRPIKFRLARLLQNTKEAAMEAKRVNVVEGDDAKCIVCGGLQTVCCNEAFDDNGTHRSPVCVDCCGPHGSVRRPEEDLW
jgi:hypothetical protein